MMQRLDGSVIYRNLEDGAAWGIEIQPDTPAEWVDERGNKYYYQHRAFTDGTEVPEEALSAWANGRAYQLHAEFFLASGNFVLHRENGPAIEWVIGRNEWWQHGVQHREDGPAIEQADGFKSWFRKGKSHRIGGPAIEQLDGRREWKKDGEHHREDGPAIEWPDGRREWWLRGVSQPDEFA